MATEEEDNPVITTETEKKLERLKDHNEWLSALSLSLLMLFLLAGGLLAYFQFYQGKGEWRFTLKHKINDTLLRASVIPQDYIFIKNENDSLRNAIVQRNELIIPEPVAEPEPEPQVVAPEPYSPDLTKPYLVQIGAFKSFNLAKYLTHVEHIEQHKQQGLNVLTIGRFETQREAQAFSKEIQNLGIKSPTVAKVEGNKIVTIKAPAPAPKKQAPVKKKTPVKKKPPVKKKSTRK